MNLTGEISGEKSFRWSVDRGTPYIPSPVLYDGLLYFNQSNQAIVRCMDSESGETLFGPQRLGNIANVSASPVAAAGKVYFVGRNGKIIVLKRSRKYEPLATNELDELFDASPALAGNQLFLRGARFLYCIEETD